MRSIFSLQPKTLRRRARVSVCATGRPPAGQSLVEFSLMAIFVITLLMGVLDLGRVFFTYLALKDAAGEGAYFASAYPECATSGSKAGCVDGNNVYDRVLGSSPSGSMVFWPNVLVTTTVGLVKEGELVTVSLSYPYKMITPFIGGRELTLQATSSAVIIRVPDCTGNPCE